MKFEINNQLDEIVATQLLERHIEGLNAIKENTKAYKWTIGIIQDLKIALYQYKAN